MPPPDQPAPKPLGARRATKTSSKIDQPPIPANGRRCSCRRAVRCSTKRSGSGAGPAGGKAARGDKRGPKFDADGRPILPRWPLVTRILPFLFSPGVPVALVRALGRSTRRRTVDAGRRALESAVAGGPVATEAWVIVGVWLFHRAEASWA